MSNQAVTGSKIYPDNYHVGEMLSCGQIRQSMRVMQIGAHVTVIGARGSEVRLHAKDLYIPRSRSMGPDMGVYRVDPAFNRDMGDRWLSLPHTVPYSAIVLGKTYEIILTSWPVTDWLIMGIWVGDRAHYFNPVG